MVPSKIMQRPKGHKASGRKMIPKPCLVLVFWGISACSAHRDLKGVWTAGAHHCSQELDSVPGQSNAAKSACNILCVLHVKDQCQSVSKDPCLCEGQLRLHMQEGLAGHP